VYVCMCVCVYDFLVLRDNVLSTYKSNNKQTREIKNFELSRYTRVCVFMCICICMSTYIYIHTTYIHTYIYTHRCRVHASDKNTHAYTYIHTYIYTRRCRVHASDKKVPGQSICIEREDGQSSHYLLFETQQVM
jgi:hypothetical protein